MSSCFSISDFDIWTTMNEWTWTTNHAITVYQIFFVIFVIFVIFYINFYESISLQGCAVTTYIFRSYFYFVGLLTFSLQTKFQIIFIRLDVKGVKIFGWNMTRLKRYANVRNLYLSLAIRVFNLKFGLDL